MPKKLLPGIIQKPYVHGSCGEDYKKESSESEAASEEENQIPIIKDNHIHPFGDTEK